MSGKTPASWSSICTSTSSVGDRSAGHRREAKRAGSVGRSLTPDQQTQVKVLVPGNEITVSGEMSEAERVARLFEEMVLLLESGNTLDRENLGRTIEMVKADERPSDVLNTAVLRGRKTIRPKTAGQKRYVDAIGSQIITFGIGPAGTGKSYLAVALAVQALQAKQVNRIVLTRPAVEAGERLRFFPGDVMAKIDPEAVQRLMERGSIEVAPLAYMRGRTLNDSFIILDEAQNTTSEQMKMFLTRLGFNSKAVITGDITQIDLPQSKRSGLIEAMDVLKNVNGLAFCQFDDSDVVRHHLVQRI